jgi:hypothetical protein
MMHQKSKPSLSTEVREAESQIKALHEENDRLKQGRENEKGTLTELTANIQSLKEQQREMDAKTKNGSTVDDETQAPDLVNSYSIEDMEDDLQKISKVSQWSTDMETMREVQEKVRLLVWDLDQQREELKSEIRRHKETIASLEEQNDLHEVKIDILTRTMREFIKEDPERWTVQGSPKYSFWFGFPFRSTCSGNSAPSVAPSDTTTVLSGSFADHRIVNEITAYPRDENMDETPKPGPNPSSSGNGQDGCKKSQVAAKQGDSLLAFDSEECKDLSPEIATDPKDSEDCSIVSLSDMEGGQPLDEAAATDEYPKDSPPRQGFWTMKWNLRMSRKSNANQHSSGESFSPEQ